MYRRAEGMGSAYATILEGVGVINGRNSGNSSLNESHSLIQEWYKQPLVTPPNGLVTV